tara:strand:- start:885 stop:1115 length:231 start_codon:yes stop_codon:yes gene_type:complete
MKSKTKLLLLSLSTIILVFMIYKLSTRKSDLTHIETVIKKHNGVRESLANPKHPTVIKPASSQIGIVAGDSVRVIQ